MAVTMADITKLRKMTGAGMMAVSYTHLDVYKRQAIICPGVTIGDRCVIGAGSVVTKDIPDDSIAVGNPARVIRRRDLSLIHILFCTALQMLRR